MRDNIPKNSYHFFCRHNDELKSLQRTDRTRQAKTSQTRRRNKDVDEFNDFKDYIMFIENKQQQKRIQLKQRRNSEPRREALTARPMTYQTNRDNQHQSKQKDQMVKPFFPFYKCRIESIGITNGSSGFRINQRKLKLNYRIIEENMGKTQRTYKPY